MTLKKYSRALRALMMVACASAAVAVGHAPAARAGEAPASFSWNGFYVGANSGVSWLHPGGLSWAPADAQTVAFGWGNCYGPGSCPPSMSSGTSAEAIFGLQAGYNHKMAGLVVGVETDLQGTLGNNHSILEPHPFGGNFVQQNYTARITALGTLRGRLGVLVKPNLLAYMTGGLAYGEVQRDYASNVFAGNINSFSSAGQSNAFAYGWTLGGGAEWAFSERMSLGAEYLYVSLPGKTFGSVGNSGVCLFGGCSFNVDARHLEENIVRLKLNFKL